MTPDSKFIVVQKEFRTVLDEARTEILNLRLEQLLHKQLFMSSEDRVDLLNETASTLFCVIQTCLSERILLRLCKLADPPVQLKNANLTLEYVIRELIRNSEVPPETAKELHTKLAAFRDNLSVITGLRNKWIAHKDLNQALAHPSDRLKYTFQQVNDASEVAREIVEKIYDLIGDSHSLDPPAPWGSDGEALVKALAMAKEHKSKCCSDSD